MNSIEYMRWKCLQTSIKKVMSLIKYKAYEAIEYIPRIVFMTCIKKVEHFDLKKSHLQNIYPLIAIKGISLNCSYLMFIDSTYFQ